jgi:RNA polymerase-binding transcription factor DksA
LRTTDPDNTSEVTEVLAAGARAALHDVLAALYRMDTGTYGICTDCGADLPIERLEVLPQVGQCLPCRRSASVMTGS